MRVLVTGGYGYIGGHLVNALLKAGWSVTILDTMFNSREWDFNPKDRLHLISASVCNSDAVARAMYGITLIYHLAARMDWKKDTKHPTRIFHTNAMGTAYVLAAAHAAGVDNVVFASSAAIYGNVIDAEEGGPTDPVNLYGCSKLAAEYVCKHYINIGMNVKVLRLFNVWGDRYSESAVGKFVAGSDVIYGDGTQTRDFVHITDVISALLMAYKWDPGSYNIGTGEELTIGGLYATLGQKEAVFNDKGPGFEEIQRSCACIDKSRSNGWEPKIKLSELSVEGVKRLCLL